MCSWPLLWAVSGNRGDEVAVLINRLQSFYLPHPEQALTSSPSVECQFQEAGGIYLQIKTTGSAGGAARNMR